jgi:hypothetical protein
MLEPINLGLLKSLGKLEADIEDNGNEAESLEIKKGYYYFFPYF